MIVFFLMFWVYGVVPHQFLTWADNELNWRSDKILFGPFDLLKSQQDGGWSPIRVNYVVLRTIAVGTTSLRSRATSGWAAWQRGEKQNAEKTPNARPSAAAREGGPDFMATTGANPPLRVPRRLHPPAGRRRLAHRPGQAEAVHPHRPVRVHHVRAASTSTRGSASIWCVPARSTKRSARSSRRRPQRQCDLHHRRRRVHPVRTLRRPVPHWCDHPRQDRRPAGRQ